MEEISDSDAELQEHLKHVNNLQPEYCDLCWLEAPLTEEEMEMLRKADLK